MVLFSLLIFFPPFPLLGTFWGVRGAICILNRGVLLLLMYECGSVVLGAHVHVCPCHVYIARMGYLSSASLTLCLLLLIFFSSSASPLWAWHPFPSMSLSHVIIEFPYSSGFWAHSWRVLFVPSLHQFCSFQQTLIGKERGREIGI